MKFISSNLLSHPVMLLERHVQSVIEIALSFFDKDKIDNQILKNILTIITFSHDIGKSIDFFPKYIRGDKSLGVVSLFLANKHLK